MSSRFCRCQVEPSLLNHMAGRLSILSCVEVETGGVEAGVDSCDGVHLHVAKLGGGVAGGWRLSCPVDSVGGCPDGHQVGAERAAAEGDKAGIGFGDRVHVGVFKACPLWGHQFPVKAVG